MSGLECHWDWSLGSRESVVWLSLFLLGIQGLRSPLEAHTSFRQSWPVCHSVVGQSALDVSLLVVSRKRTLRSPLRLVLDREGH